MANQPTIHAELITYFSVEELCGVTAVERQFIVQLVEYGILEPEGRDETEWRFAEPQLRCVQRAAALKHDLHVNVPGIGLILQLLDELEQLRREK